MAKNKGNSHIVLITILLIVVVLAVIFGLFKHFGMAMFADHSSDTASDETEAAGIVVQDEENSLEENKYPQVNALIDNYRKAILNGDTDLLKQVYNTEDDVNQDLLTGTSDIIKSYNNTQYYTKNGLQSGEYVAFVYDELELAGIDTLAPNLSIYYIKTADDGSLYIYRGEYDQTSGTYVYDEETQDYINSLYKEQDVKELIAAVNTRLDSACANDEDLMKFIEKIRTRTTDITETESESSSVSESESETESETDSVFVDEEDTGTRSGTQ
jgi:hypothetical protein